jgi:hypothetical protein
MCFHSHDRREGRADDPVSVDDRRTEFIARAMRFGGVMVVCTFIWLLSGAGYFWPGWVLLVGGIGLGRAAREAWGPGSGDLSEADAYTA